MPHPCRPLPRPLPSSTGVSVVRSGPTRRQRRCARNDKTKREVTKTKREVTKTKREVTKTKREVTKTKREVTRARRKWRTCRTTISSWTTGCSSH
eukprot:scaffold27270_cov73-Isochrysis_galbana.AAC.1